MTYFEPILDGGGWLTGQIRNEMTVELANELLGTLLDEKLGYGVSREVYSVKYTNKIVAKIERPRIGHFANVTEFQIWNGVQETKAVEWFAPSRALSLGGQLLLQARTEPIPWSKLPAKIPSFFTDLKPENFGLWEGRVVCHDYALSKIIARGVTNFRMVDSGWR